MRLFLVWLVNAVSLLLVGDLMPAISINSFTTALIVALVLGLINTVIRPLLVLLTLPVTLLTLGLFIFVINGLLFWWVGSSVDGFIVESFWYGMIGAIVYSLIAWVLAYALLPKRERFS